MNRVSTFLAMTMILVVGRVSCTPKKEHLVQKYGEPREEPGTQKPAEVTTSLAWTDIEPIMLSRFSHLRGKVDEETWKTFNNLKSQGYDRTQIAESLSLSETQVSELESVRACVLKYPYSKDSLRLCIEGRIDP